LITSLNAVGKSEDIPTLEFFSCTLFTMAAKDMISVQLGVLLSSFWAWLMFAGKN